MSRIIKFRAWDGKQMLYDFHVSADTGRVFECYNGSYGGGHFDTPGGSDEVEVLSLMQFTGLYDKNGKEIYEGDVLMHEDYMPIHNKLRKEIHTPRKDGMTTTTVEWCGPHNEDRYHGAVGFNIGTGLLSLGDGVTVIGNIWENPELLKP